MNLGELELHRKSKKATSRTVNKHNMDFDQATKRLENEHRRRREDQVKRMSRSHLASPALTAKLQQRDEYHRKQQQEKRDRELAEKRRLDVLADYMNSIEKDRLGYVHLSSDQQSNFHGIHLKATSIHGQGDKVTLPPSILSFLAQNNALENQRGSGQPLFFRLGIERDNYVFPSSPKLRQLAAYTTSHSIATDLDDEDDLDTNTIPNTTEPYLYEISHKFASYTFATVIEFTEEEGCIGLPYDVANALLDPAKCDYRRNCEAEPSLQTSRTNIDSTFTVDVSNTVNEHIHGSSTFDSYTFGNETNGHPAYGAFPIPLRPVHVSLLTHIPLGRSCKLRPTHDAIHHGFHRLKDIKLVLEQSLIKTRATLSLGDTVHAWFRGIRYDLIVDAVEPSDFGVVSCVNTDITVDFVSEEHDVSQGALPSTTSDKDHQLDTQLHSTVANSNLNPGLPAEPLDGENIVTVRIRWGDATSKQRRFDASSTLVQTLFDYARLENIIQGDSVNVSEYQLVTRFPRRVLDYINDGNKTLIEAGIGDQNQIMLLIERIKIT